MREQWLLVVAPIILLVGLAVLIAAVRAPTFSAETRLSVGGTELPTDSSVSNFVLGTASLAATYSRLVTSSTVVQSTSTALGIPPEEVAENLEATPIPESPVFRVIASSATAEDAVVLANQASQSLIASLELSPDSPETLNLLADVRDAAQDVADADGVAERAEAQLRLTTARGLYQERQEQITRGSLIQVLNPATTATSDQPSILQRLGFVGLIGGLAVGATLATLRANSIRKRRPDLPSLSL